MEKKAVKKEQSSFMKAVNRNRYCIYSFFIAAAIMLFVYIVYKFAPIGKMTVLRMDLYHQYGPLFAEFFERVTNLDSLIYSWCSGLGGSFTGNYLNYLASPIGNIIMLLAGHENMPEAIAVTILVKAALSAATFTYFINNHFNRRDASSSAFSVLYAFCGYFMAYYWNIMWLDGVVFLPLIILGITKIIDGKTPWLYIGSLAAVMLTSYYMAYMICIISVIWFLVYFFTNYDFSSVMTVYSLRLTRREYNSLSSKDKSTLSRRNLINNRFLFTGCKFAGSSFLAFGLAAAALIPVYFVLKTCSATGNSFPTDYKSYFNIFDFLANHLAGATPTIRSSGENVLPNVYSGVLPLILVPLFLFSNKTPIREKISSVCLLAVFYFSFNINYLNFIWHGFHFPNDLPYRFSFAYTFFLLYFAYKAFMNLEYTSSKAIMGTGTAIIAFTVLVQKIGSKNIMVTENNVETASDTIIWATIVFTVIYCVILSFIKNPKYLRTAMCALLLCCTATEIIVVDTQNYEIQQEKTWFAGDYNDFVELKEKTDAQELSENPNGFYRMELSQLRARMDPCWYYYNGVSVFSSMAYESVSKMMKNIGMFGNNVNSYTYYPQTPVYNTMFGLKYVFDNSERLTEDKYYTEGESNDTFTSFRYNYDMPIAFCVNPEFEDWTTNSGTNPFDNQSAMWSLATGTNGIFKDLKYKATNFDNLSEISDDTLNSGSFTLNKKTNGVFAGMSVEIEPEESGNIYLYIHSANCDSSIVSSPRVNKDMDVTSPYVLDCGYVEKGEKVSVDLQLPNDKDTAEVKFYAVMIDNQVFEQGYNNLKKYGTFEYTSFKDSHFTGKINAAADKILYTSIPYDEGWTITVDGVKVDKKDYIKIADSLLALPIAAGEHTVEFKYSPKGLTVGIAVTAVSILILVAIVLMKKKRELLFSEKFIDKVSLRHFEPTIRIAETTQATVSDQEYIAEGLFEDIPDAESENEQTDNTSAENTDISDIPDNTEPEESNQDLNS